MGGGSVEIAAAKELSRAFCAGLIEAPAARRLNGWSNRYPVRFARASLKLVARAKAAASCSGYPVRFARASLKRIRPEFECVYFSMLSRAFCAGLIEAHSIAMGRRLIN